MPGAKGTKENIRVLKAQSGESEFTAYRDKTANPPAIVVNVGKTELRYHMSSLDDLHSMLKAKGDWVPLGDTDEQKPAKGGHGSKHRLVHGQPGGRMVRSEEGAAGTFCHVHSADHGTPRNGRGGAQPPEQ